MTYDLTRVFDYVGNLFVREMRTRILELREDIAGQKFTPIKPSTALKRQAMLGANRFRINRHAGSFFNRGITLTTQKVRRSPAKSVPITRLLFTGRFAKGAFTHKAYPDRVVVSVSRGMYPGHWTQPPVSYGDIVKWNNAGSPKVNPNIDSPPLIFPNPDRPEQVRRMTSYKKATDFIASPNVRNYVNDRLLRQALRKVSIEVTI